MDWSAAERGREWRRRLNRHATDHAIGEVRRALAVDTGRLDRSSGSLIVSLRTLHRRLNGIRALGGAYADVEVSEHLEGLLRKVGTAELVE